MTLKKSNIYEDQGNGKIQIIPISRVAYRDDLLVCIPCRGQRQRLPRAAYRPRNKFATIYAKDPLLPLKKS